MEKTQSSITLRSSIQTNSKIGENDELIYFLKGMGYKENRISILNKLFSVAKKHKETLTSLPTKKPLKIDIKNIDTLLYNDSIDLIIQSVERTKIEGDIIKIELNKNWVNIDYSWKLKIRFSGLRLS